MKLHEILFILYVKDPVKSKKFYISLLQIEPQIDVPGMTEFRLYNNVRFGIMPEDGMAKIIGNKLPHPKKANGIPRCEMYLVVENATQYIHRAIDLGGVEISPFSKREWGDSVGYIADLDGHIIAFAEKNN